MHKEYNKYINTRDFGKIEVNKDDIIKFTGGILGFSQYKDYVILKDDPFDDVMFLQSMEDEALSFVLVDPYAVVSDFDPVLNSEDLAELQVEKECELKYLLIAIIGQDVKDSVVNLKSPIAVNPNTKFAKQIILQNSYPLRYNIIAAEGDAKC